MGPGAIGFVVGLIVAFLAIRAQENTMRRSGYGTTSMIQREALNRLRIVGVGDHRPSGCAEYGCALVLLPAVGLVIGLVIGAIVD